MFDIQQNDNYRAGIADSREFYTRQPETTD